MKGLSGNLHEYRKTALTPGGGPIGPSSWGTTKFARRDYGIRAKVRQSGVVSKRSYNEAWMSG